MSVPAGVPPEGGRRPAWSRRAQPLTEGSQNPQEILAILGRDAVQRYLVDQVQTVYRMQGVNGA